MTGTIAMKFSRIFLTVLFFLTTLDSVAPAHAQLVERDPDERATPTQRQPVRRRTTEDFAAGNRRYEEPVTVRINGDVVRFEGQPPIEERGRVLVPLRGVLEKLGAFVEYDSVRRSVTAIRGRTTILLGIGAIEATVNDRPVALDSPARTVGGSVLVPLRFVAESLGAQVRYDADLRTVLIRTSGSGPIVPPIPSPEDLRNVRGTVVAIYSDLNPKRLVVRVTPPSADADREEPDEERTIPLAREATVVLRRGSSISNFEFGRITRGDKVRIRTNEDGDAETITVLADSGDGNPQPLPPPRPAPPTRPEDDPLPGATTRILRGTVLRVDRVSSGLYAVTLTNGRTIRVSAGVPVTYAGQKIALADVQRGDAVIITQNIQTQRGTKIAVSNVR